jgi:cytochrome c
MRILSLGLCLSLCACLGTKPELAIPTSRGASVAARDCAGCHGTGASDQSPRSAAPPFRQLALRYNELSLERKLAEMNGRAHFDMPATTFQTSEIADLAAYIAASR